MKKEFVINKHGRIVLPFNFFPDLDFSVIETLEQFKTVISRDFGEKAPTEKDILERLSAGKYKSRFELCRDLALNLYWVNRFALTMYEERPTRWADLPRQREDVFLPACKPWDSARVAGDIQEGYAALPYQWQSETEDEAFGLLLNGFRSKHSPGGDLRAIQPTVGEMLAARKGRTLRLLSYDPDFPGYSYDDVIQYSHEVPEMEALMRQAMILHNQYRWDPLNCACVEVSQLKDDDYVIALYPRTKEVLQFISRVKRGVQPHAARFKMPSTPALSAPVTPYKPIEVRKQYKIMPKLEGLGVYEGEVVCTNADLIRNHAFSWSRMTEAEIGEKTGIQQRLYSELKLEQMGLLAARAALKKSGRKPSEIGAVLFCSCTSARMLPSTACWIAGELGIQLVHASNDIVAACAGMAYGFSAAVRLLQDINRPVLVVCAEKFSDKIGTVRTSRMIFGDGAAAAIIGPAPEGAPPDIEVMQTYAGGPWSEVNSIIWPNPEFNNDITVFGPEVKNLAGRYLVQMMGDLAALKAEDGVTSLMDTIDLVIPHQANKTMVEKLADAAGVPRDHLYFDIERVGNTSAASIPIAIRDAVVDQRIDRPMRIFAPGFGAGAVAGFLVMRIDPAVVCCAEQPSLYADEGGEGKMSLAGRVALVTGAARGIGKAIATEMARRGASVAINYRSDVEGAEAVAKDIRKLGVGCIVIQGDVSINDDAQRIVRTVLDKWQRIDVLVNNAGISKDHTLQKMTDEDWEKVIETNLNGTFNTTTATLPAMINQRFGRIINVTSVGAQAGSVGQANSAASKGGITAFTKSVALESAKYNITANTIAPGYTATEMMQEIPEKLANQIKAKIPLGRFATPREVAKAAVFLAADADYITGQELNVNGGCHM
jgi:3-oxoacyl-(acyl-carrier-protein) synthase III